MKDCTWLVLSFDKVAVQVLHLNEWGGLLMDAVFIFYKVFLFAV
jgi:hypothetical protein